MSLNLASEARPSYAKPLLVAVAVLAAVAAAVFYFNPHRTAELTVTHTGLFAPQTEFKAQSGSVHVIGALGYTEKDLYVIATVHLQNELRLPLFLDEVTATYTAPDGSVQPTTAPAHADLSRVEAVFPQLTAQLPHPLLAGDEIAPKAAADGQVLLHFNGLGSADWQARKPSTLTMHFVHQEPITITIP